MTEWNPLDNAERPSKGLREEWYEKAKAEAEAEKSDTCGYCVGECVHGVGQSQESGLRFVYSQILEHGIPMRFDMLPSSDYWTPFPPATRQPKDLPVYTIANGKQVWRSGPNGGTSNTRKSRTGGTVARSKAGEVLARIKAAGLDPMSLTQSQIQEYAK